MNCLRCSALQCIFWFTVKNIMFYSQLYRAFIINSIVPLRPNIGVIHLGLISVTQTDTVFLSDEIFCREFSAGPFP